MKKSFLLENGAPFFALQLCPSRLRTFFFAGFSALFSLLGAVHASACDIKLTVTQNTMLFKIDDPSGNASDVYTWSITGDIDANGSGGTGAAPLAASIELVNNTSSVLTWKVNGAVCATKKVRVKYVCETPGFTVVNDPLTCTVTFNPYSSPPVVKAHTWNFGDGSEESDLATTQHQYTDPGGVFTATHTTVEWNGIEFTVDRCVVLVNIDCSELLQPPTTGIDESASFSELIKVFPNPVTDWVQADASGLSVKPVMARFYNMTGVLVSEQNWPSDQDIAQFDMSTFASGNYVMEIIGGDGNRKVVLNSKL